MSQTGFANINGAELYYEIAGDGIPFVMIHAGIADNRMWNYEFKYFSDQYQAMRFDIRGYGKSKPVQGEWNIHSDFDILLDKLNLQEPMIIMGCSIGAGLALEFALAYPDRVKALILVGGFPEGFEPTTQEPDELFAKAKKAFDENDLDRATEFETQIWFDGMGRTKNDVDPETRQFAYDMNRVALGYEAQNIGTYIRKVFDTPAAERLPNLTLPTLIIVGDKDLPTIVEAGKFMHNGLPNSTYFLIENAAHLPNLEHPKIFCDTINQFLQTL